MSQTEAIRRHLEAGEPLDGLTALERYGCFRLAARVEELRRAGLAIDADIVTSENGKRFARYRMTDRRP